MRDQLLHTPEGVRDIYGSECEKKIFLQDTIHEVIKKYGYDDIQTPSFEFFDIFAKERGSVASKNMYKFFDREGYTLALRPDITPSIARCVAKYYGDTQEDLRLCYLGNTFINNSEYQGKLKESTQCGAELIGDNKSDADAEIVAMVVNSLLACGLRDFQIELGHVDFLTGLLEDSKFSYETCADLKELLYNKNYFAVEEYVSNLSISDELKEILVKLPELTGQDELIKEYMSKVTNEKSKNALDRLLKVYDIIKVYGYEDYISFDLGMVSNYDYYTGIILGGYTYGTGDAIVTGGRYDKLLSQFGKIAPSIGFGINVDRLLVAMNRQNVKFSLSKQGTMIVYSKENRDDAVKKAAIDRDCGKVVRLICKSSKFTETDYVNQAKEAGLEILFML